jgi:hypothetical protein
MKWKVGHELVNMEAAEGISVSGSRYQQRLVKTDREDSRCAVVVASVCRTFKVFVVRSAIAQPV